VCHKKNNNLRISFLKRKTAGFLRVLFALLVFSNFIIADNNEPVLKLKKAISKEENKKITPEKKKNKTKQKRQLRDKKEYLNYLESNYDLENTEAQSLFNLIVEDFELLSNINLTKPEEKTIQKRLMLNLKKLKKYYKKN